MSAKKSKASTAKRTSPTLRALAWKPRVAALILLLAGLMAYSNSFHGPFVLDDSASITENPTIQHGWLGALQPPANGETVTGRPLVNLSLALNYQWSGLNPTSYHAVNLAIHLLAALALFGLVRQTLLLPKLRERWGAQADYVALAVALLWMLHPLQTESVTYVIQRAESLMGLCFLLTIYCFVRGTQARPQLWLSLSVLACLLGVFCKEVIVTAPLLVLLYDRAFVAESLSGAFKQRGKYYAALFATWLPLAWLVATAGTRGASAGFNTGVSSRDYAVSQAPAVINYLKLSFWPHSLVFDYGTKLIKNPADAALPLLLIALLAAATLWLLWRRPMLGFLGAWFFITLAPSSSIVPIVTETAAEHRMYLPLAAIVVLVVAGLWRFSGQIALGVVVFLAGVLGAATFAHNRDYQSAEALWHKTVFERPDVARAHENYGLALADAGQTAAALDELRMALRLKPDYPEGENNLGRVLAQTGALEEAASHFATASLTLLRPHERALAYFNLGNAFGGLHRYDDALKAYTQSIELDPDFPVAYNLRGLALFQLGRYDGAILNYQLALKLQPDFPQCAANLAEAQARLRSSGSTNQQ